MSIDQNNKELYIKECNTQTVKDGNVVSSSKQANLLEFGPDGKKLSIKIQQAPQLSITNESNTEESEQIDNQAQESPHARTCVIEFNGMNLHITDEKMVDKIANNLVQIKQKLLEANNSVEIKDAESMAKAIENIVSEISESQVASIGDNYHITRFDPIENYNLYHPVFGDDYMFSFLMNPFYSIDSVIDWQVPMIAEG